jgi:prepilin-type processing-associated H-X9-DG protein
VGFALWGRVTAALLFGWAAFLYRVLPRVTPDGGSLVVGVVAVLLFTVGIHAAGRRWRRASGQGPWRWRWSLSAVAAVFLLFAAGVSLVAMTHQVGWLLTSPEPWHVSAVKHRWGVQRSSSNLRMIGIAMQGYESTYGSLPPGGSFTPDGTALHSWETQLLVFMGFSLRNRDFGGGQIDFKVPWNDPRNVGFFQAPLPPFLNPDLPGNDLLDADGFGLSHYAANVHVMGPNRGLKFGDLKGGTANTLLVGEVSARFRPWGDPVNWRDPAKGINRSPDGFGGPPGAGGANFCMADGSVRFVSQDVSPDALRALGSPDVRGEIDPAVLQPPR